MFYEAYPSFLFSFSEKKMSMIVIKRMKMCVSKRTFFVTLIARTSLQQRLVEIVNAARPLLEYETGKQSSLDSAYFSFIRSLTLRQDHY